MEVYNVHGQCCVRSWSLQSSDRLSCPAVYHHPSQRYFAVRNGQELLSWSEGAEAIDHTPQPLPTNVHSLLTPDSLPWVGVIYHNGTLGLLEEDGRGGEVPLMGRATRRTNPTVLATDLWVCGREEVAVVLYSLQGQCHISLCALRKDATPTTTALKAEGQLLCCCVCGSELVSSWTSGNTLSTSLEQLCKPSHSQGTHSRQHTLTLSPSPTLLAGISEHYFALGQIDSSSGAERGTIVSVWDTRYGTCQARTTIAVQYTSQLCHLHGFLLAVGGEGVMVCSVGCEDGGVLSAALGRGQVETIKDSLLIVPSWVQPDKDCGDWEEGTRQSDSEERAFLAVLTDPAKTPTLDSFMAQLQSRPLPPGGAGCAAVVRRVLGEKRFWARKALTEMLAQRLVPLSLTGDLLVSALERKDWPLVSMALRHCEAVPEHDLVRLLQETLSLPAEVKSYGATLRKKHLLCQLLSQPRNDALLQQPLSQLPFPLVMALLEFLGSHVAMEACLSSPPLHHLPQPAALDWLGLLLDVHFAQLSLVPGAKHTLVALQQQIDDQVELCEGLSLVQALRDVQQKGSRSEEHSLHMYQVEELNVKV